MNSAKRGGMMGSQKKAYGARFLAFATATPFETTVLATATPPSSAAARRAARVLAGSLDVSRVERLAVLLDELVILDKAGRKNSR